MILLVVYIQFYNTTNELLRIGHPPQYFLQIKSYQVDLHSSYIIFDEDTNHFHLNLLPMQTSHKVRF